jgi:hypothetical protein
VQPIDISPARHFIAIADKRAVHQREQKVFDAAQDAFKFGARELHAPQGLVVNLGLTCPSEVLIRIDEDGERGMSATAVRIKSRTRIERRILTPARRRLVESRCGQTHTAAA